MLDEYCLDLVEYCYRTISSLLSFPSNADTAADVGTTPKDIYQTFKTSTYLEFGYVLVFIQQNVKLIFLQRQMCLYPALPLRGGRPRPSRHAHAHHGEVERAATVRRVD